MTRPGNDGGLAPARRNRSRLASPASGPALEDATDLEIARGQADAVLGALARMQLRLDVFGREQSDLLHQVVERVAALEGEVQRLTGTAPGAHAAVESPAPVLTDSV